MSQQVKKSLVLSIYFALAISTLLVFWQVRNFDFVNYDDNVYVSENPYVQGGLTADGIWWAFTANRSAHWHPVTWLSLMLDNQLFGLNPAGFHITNLIFHIINTLLLFFVLKQMTGAIWQSAFVAALFALHPLHVESVVWISERKDVLSTFFWFLTMWAYIRFVSRPKITNYLLIVVFFALGLMSKPMLVTLPFVLLLLDYWPLDRFRNAGLIRLILEKIPLFALAVISSVITFLVMRSGGVITIDIIPLNYRIANAFLSYMEYIYKMFWPQNLAVFYPLGASGSIPFWQIAAFAALLLAVISIFIVRLGRNQRYLLLGWFWFLGTLIPVIGIIQVGAQAYADRYTYVPYIGLFVMIAWGLPQLLSKLLAASSVESPQRKIILGLSMIIVLTALGICAHRQTSYWNNSISLFTHAIEVTKNNYLAYNNRGTAYGGLGRYTDAMADFRQAVKIQPHYAEAYTNIGCTSGRFGRFQEAIDAFSQSIKINPNNVEAYFNLGVCYRELGRYAEALDAFGQTVKIMPDYVKAHTNLGIVYTMLGRYTEAIEAHKQAIKIMPDCAEAYTNLGIVYTKLDRGKDAVDAYKQAIRINPYLVEAHYNLGYVYLALGDKNSALTEYNILKSLNYKLADNLLQEINK